MTQTNPQLDDRVRKMPQYQEGRDAFFNCANEDDNPYPRSGLGSKGFDQRTAWFTGFFDERTAARLWHVFVRYDIEWP